jgi:hypothetical protein
MADWVETDLFDVQHSHGATRGAGAQRFMHSPGHGQRMHCTWTQVAPEGQSAEVLHPGMHSPGPWPHRPHTRPRPHSASV